MNAQYLGDAVYAHTDGNHIVLTTDSHHPPEAGNIIYLEPVVFDALVDYVEKLKEHSDAS